MDLRNDSSSNYCLLHDVMEEQMTEVNGVGRRITKLLDDLRNRRRYWELKKEAEHRNRWKRQLHQSNIRNKYIQYLP